MSIPIFDGKQTTYNQMILETLLINGELTAWQLAKDIEPKIRIAGDLYHKSQKIYSVLIRKNGRLLDLQHKGYVVVDANTKKWRCATKGLIAILLHKPRLRQSVNPIYSQGSIEDLKIKKKVEIAHLGITINGEQFKLGLEALIKQAKKDKTWISDFLEARNFLEEINFDKVSGETLLFLLARRWYRKRENRLPEVFFVSDLNGVSEVP